MPERRQQKEPLPDQDDRRAGPRRRYSIDEAHKVVDALAGALAENGETSQELEEQRDRNAELEARLYTDVKTGVYNENAFNEKLPALLELARNNGFPIALVLADTDGLKRTNEAMGHPIGDELLKATARAIKKGSRSDDTVGRLSGDKGDEFYAILSGFAPVEGYTEEELFTSTVEKYRGAIGAEISELGLPEHLKAGVSFGIAVLSQEDLQRLEHLRPEELMRTLYAQADMALLENKEQVRKQLADQGMQFPDSRVA